MEKLTGTRFGEIEFESGDVLSFPAGLIGFPHLSEFILVQHKDNSPFRWLQSVNEPALAFLIADPNHYVSGYQPEISDQDAIEMKLSEETATLLFTTVSIPSGNPEALTLNLAGPILINLETRTARQFVVENPAWPTKYCPLEAANAA